MRRTKRPEADLRRTYRRRLARSCGLSALLHLVLFALNPRLGCQAPPPRPLPPVVVTLEPVPQTQPPLSARQAPPPPPPGPAAPVRPALRPREPLVPVIARFAPEDEDDAVEFWMLEWPPRVLRRVLPVYPDSARAAMLEGRVFVRLLLDTEGRVERISSIVGPAVFHAAAAAAARQWEFAPAIQNERPVRVWVSVPFRFELAEQAR